MLPVVLLRWHFSFELSLFIESLSFHCSWISIGLAQDMSGMLVALFSRSVFRPLLGLNVRNYREFRTSHVYGETCPYYFLRLLPLHLGCLQFIFTWICSRIWAPFLVSLLSFLLSELPSLSPTLCTPFCNTRHSLMSLRFYSPYKPSDNGCNYFSLHVNEVEIKRVGRFSWCSVWRYRARTTNVAFT